MAQHYSDPDREQLPTSLPDVIHMTQHHYTNPYKSASDRAYSALLAKRQLEQAQRTRQNYDDLLQAAIREYGDVAGTPTSGCYNPAFPEQIKNELRTLAHNIGVQVEQAYSLWRKARRRVHTLRPFAEDARKLKDGRVSYY